MDIFSGCSTLSQLAEFWSDTGCTYQLYFSVFHVKASVALEILLVLHG